MEDVTRFGLWRNNLIVDSNEVISLFNICIKVSLLAVFGQLYLNNIVLLSANLIVVVARTSLVAAALILDV